MHTFAQKPKTSRQTTSTESTTPTRYHLAQSPKVTSILYLQHTIGNQAVQRMYQAGAQEPEAASLGLPLPSFGHDFSRISIRSPLLGAIQTKLAINKPGDEYEQEADRVAEQVMTMSEPKLERSCSYGGGCPNYRWEVEQLNSKDKVVQARHVQKSTTEMDKPPPIVQEVIRSPGRNLDPSTRAFFEPRFGYDFSRVRIHAESQASDAARAISAKAFTVGQDIVFRQGQYAPETNTGRSLLAHELTHVIQQSDNRNMVHRGAPALSQSKGISVQRTPDIPDFIDIARRLHKAMEGLGTDEPAIFTALGELGGDREAGDELKRVYRNRYVNDLEADLRGDLSGTDLARALRLLNPSGTAGGAAPPSLQAQLAQLRAKVHSIDKDGSATMSLHQDTASGKIRGYQLHQAFRAKFDNTAIASNYAIIQWVKGELYETRNGNRTYWPASTGLYGRSDTQPWRFTDWVIDSPDADPRFGSNRGIAVSVPTTQFDDSPGILYNSGPLPAGLHWQVDARVGVYPWGAGVPKYIAGWESQRPQPFVEKAWGWTVEVNTDQVSLNVNIT